MFKKLLALLYMFLFMLLLGGCNLLYMPHLEQDNSVYITAPPLPTPNAGGQTTEI